MPGREIREHGRYRCTVPPSSTVLPFLLDRIKAEIGILDDDEINEQLRDIARATIRRVEKDARRVIMPQTWQLLMDEFPCHEQELRIIPIQSITHVKYRSGGSQLTLSASIYETDLVSEPARIRPKSGYRWPTTDCVMNAVEIEFIAGYEDADAVPPDVRDVIIQATRGRWLKCDLGQAYWDMINGIKTFGFVV